MARIVMEEQEEILTFPVDTILELKIERTEIETVQGRREDWEKCKFEFKVLGIQALGDGRQNFDDYANWITKSMYGSVGWRLTTSPENKLRIWAEAIFRQELGPGFELDNEMFHGRKVRGLVSHYEAKQKGPDGKPRKRHQIETLLPFGETAPSLGKPAAAAAPAAAPAADPWAAPAAPAAAADPWGDGWGSDEPPF